MRSQLRSHHCNLFRFSSFLRATPYLGASSPHSSPLLSLISLSHATSNLSLWTCLFLTFCVKRNSMCSLLSCVLSSSVLFSRYIEAAFHCWVIVHCLDMLCFICPFFISQGLRLGLFVLSGYYQECCCEHSCTDFWRDVCSHFLGYDPEVELLGFMVALCLTFLRGA